MKLLLTPFIWVLNFFYGLTGSYGLALILFAVVVKLILFPFQLKGKKSMIQMNMLNGQMQKLQKQYAKNQQKYQEEVQKLYERAGVNPMSGCLWSLLPILILLPLYAIIREPLVYIMNLSADQLGAVAEAVNWSTQAVANGWIKEAADFANTGYNQLYLASLITPENLAAVQAALGEAGSQVFAINFNFLGLIDLSQIPQVMFWTIEGGFWLFLLPVISAASGLVMSFISMRTNAINKQSADAANNASMKSMMIISPLISLWVGFAMPAALCLYWVAQNVLSMLTEFISGKLLKKDYEEAARKQAEREEQEKEEEKERRRQAAEERAGRLEEAKKAKGKKKKELMEELNEKDKGDSAVISVSGVGMRAYARGRAYDPNRFSPNGPTPYTDPDVAARAAAAQAQVEEKKGLFGSKKKKEHSDEDSKE